MVNNKKIKQKERKRKNNIEQKKNVKMKLNIF